MTQYKNNKPTLVRFDADTHGFLLGLTKAIQKAHGVHVGRSTIVRAVVAGVAKANPDLIANEIDIERRITHMLSKIQEVI